MNYTMLPPYIWYDPAIALPYLKDVTDTRQVIITFKGNTNIVYKAWLMKDSDNSYHFEDGEGNEFKINTIHMYMVVLPPNEQPNNQ